MSYNEQMYALGAKRSVIREIFEYSHRRAAEIGADKVFDFSLGNPSVEPPAKVRETLMRLLQEREPTALHGYTSAGGDLATRQAVANRILSQHGVDISPDLIYMTAGAAASLTVTLRALLRAGEECIIVAPFFTEYRVFIQNAGGVPVISMPDPVTFQIDIGDLARRITANTKAIILNSPNNPSGVVYTAETLCALSELLRARAAEYGHPIYLIADEPYRELVFDGIEVPYPMHAYKDTVVCYSWSKSLSLPGERIGYIAVNPACTDAQALYFAVCGAGRSMGYVCAPSLMQHLIAEIGDVTVDLAPYRENRDLLFGALTQYGYTCVRPDGAFYLFVAAPGEDAAAFCAKAREEEILVVPCDDFGVEGYFRIAYCVDRARIQNALPGFARLAKHYGL